MPQTSDALPWYVGSGVGHPVRVGDAPPMPRSFGCAASACHKLSARRPVSWRSRLAGRFRRLQGPCGMQISPCPSFASPAIHVLGKPDGRPTQLHTPRMYRTFNIESDVPRGCSIIIRSVYRARHVHTRFRAQTGQNPLRNLARGPEALSSNPLLVSSPRSVPALGARPRGVQVPARRAGVG